MAFSLVRLGVLGAVVAVGVGAASRADAFCRTVTQATAPEYNAQTDGCYVGTPDPKTGLMPKELFWKNTCVSYDLQQDASNQVTLDEATTAMASAFQAWVQADCGSGGVPSIKAFDLGPVSCSNVQYNTDGANQHVIAFRDTSWPHSDPNNTLALTTVTFDTTSGEIYDADMEINSTPGNKLDTTGSNAPGTFDFASIVTHETGHFLGLAHSTESTAIMFAHYKSGAAVLTSDDTAGICTIYPPGAKRSTSDGIIDAEQCDDTPRHGFSTECDAPAVDPPVTTTKKGCAVSSGAVGSASGSAGNFGLLAIGAVALGMAARRRNRRAGDASDASGATILGMKRVRAAAAATFLSLSAIAASAFVTNDAQASVSIAILFDDLVHDASAVAVATAVEQRAVWENGRIYTYTRLRVDTPVAGSLPADPWVRTLGGVVGKIGQSVEGEAVLTIGKSSLLFLQPQIYRDANGETKAPDGMFEVTARAQGQFPVVADANAKTSHVIHAYGVGALMAPPADRIARVTQLHVTQIRAGASVTAAAQGAPLAQDVLHNRPVVDATNEIAAAWSRLHTK